MRLTANKTKLYALVAEYWDGCLPPIRRTQFIKHFRSRDYRLEWTSSDGNPAHAFFSTCMGVPLLAVEVRDSEHRRTLRRSTYRLELQELRRREMLEESSRPTRCRA